jgi:hypothetical protein
MAGATAAAAAATPHAHAQTAQISLINNQLDSISGNLVSLEVTTGHPFGMLDAPPFLHTATGQVVLPFTASPAGNRTFTALVIGSHFQVHLHASAATPKSVLHTGTHVQKAFDLVPLTLSDPNVAAGQVNTNALLEIEAFNQSTTDQTVALLAVFYPESGNTTPSLTIDSTTGAISGDTIDNVGSSNAGVFTAAAPEPSGLALLALGAGGILARRQRRKAA